VIELCTDVTFICDVLKRASAEPEVNLVSIGLSSYCNRFHTSSVAV